MIRLFASIRIYYKFILSPHADSSTWLDQVVCIDLYFREFILSPTLTAAHGWIRSFVLTYIEADSEPKQAAAPARVTSEVVEYYP